jgi:NAD-specific glutamate dehydrogenase
MILLSSKLFKIFLLTIIFIDRERYVSSVTVKIYQHTPEEFYRKLNSFKDYFSVENV